MADVTPNYSLESMALELEKAQLELNVRSQLYRIAQTADEVRRIQANIDATHNALQALTEKIAALNPTPLAIPASLNPSKAE